MFRDAVRRECISPLCVFYVAPEILNGSMPSSLGCSTKAALLSLVSWVREERRCFGLPTLPDNTLDKSDDGIRNAKI